MVNYIFNKGSLVNIGKNINIDARGMNKEKFDRLVDLIVNGDDKSDKDTDDEQTYVETAFNRSIPHKDYVMEFGDMPSATYSDWMKENANYTKAELEKVVKSYVFK